MSLNFSAMRGKQARFTLKLQLPRHLFDIKTQPCKQTTPPLVLEYNHLHRTVQHLFGPTNTSPPSNTSTNMPPANPSLPAASVWAVMSYTPPRGRCNHKTSLMSPACPCLRFMLHPVKAATSFECDGCGHHASFHSMENKDEDEVVKRWEAEKSKDEAKGQSGAGAGRKRRRIAEKPANDTGAELREVLEIEDDETSEGAEDTFVFPGSFVSTPASRSNTQSIARPAPRKRGAAQADRK